MLWYIGSYQVQELVESGNQMISVVRLVGNLVEHLQNQPHSNIVLGCNVCKLKHWWHILTKIS